MLNIKNISTGYGNHKVISDFSLNIRKNSITYLKGKNASGKSTLFKVIYGLIPLWSGNIYFNGNNISNEKPHNIFKNGLFYLPQKNYTFENLTVDDNLRIAGQNLSKNDLNNKIKNIYDEYNLYHLKNRNTFKLSGGELKKLGILMALIGNPKLVLLDEPFAGLDNNNIKIINKLINMYNDKNITFLIISNLKLDFKKYFII